MLQLQGPGFNPGIFNIYSYSEGHRTVQKTGLGAENSTYKTKSVAYSQHLSAKYSRINVNKEAITTIALLFRRSRRMYFLYGAAT